MRPHNRSVVRASAQTTSDGSKSLASTLRDVLKEGAGHPYIYKRSLLTDKLSYRNDFHSLSGRSQYLNAATLWYERQNRLLPNVKSEVLSVSQLSQTEVIIKWKVSWVRPAGFWLYQLGTALKPLTIEYKDSLDKIDKESKISWKAIARLFGRIITERVVQVPLAVVLGSSRLQFAQVISESNSESNTAADDLVLVRCTEQLDLVPMYDSGTVKNRSVTRDLLLFELVRQPPGASTEEWMASVNSRLDTARVPGMGTFDIGGQTEAERAQAYDDAATALGYLTFCVLVVGTVVGYTYFQGLPKF